MTTSRIMSARCEVALMKPITGAAGRTLDHHLEALTHQRLAFQELMNLVVVGPTCRRPSGCLVTALPGGRW